MITMIMSQHIGIDLKFIKIGKIFICFFRYGRASRCDVDQHHISIADDAENIAFAIGLQIEISDIGIDIAVDAVCRSKSKCTAEKNSKYRSGMQFFDEKNSKNTECKCCDDITCKRISHGNIDVFDIGKAFCESTCMEYEMFGDRAEKGCKHGNPSEKCQKDAKI